VISGAFLPGQTRAVTTSEDATVRVWKVGPPTPVATFTGDTRNTRDEIFSPDGKLALTLGPNGRARLLDAATRAPVAIQPGDQRLVLGAAFSPNSEHVVMWFSDGSAQVWNVRTGKSETPIGKGQVSGALYADDGSQILAKFRDGSGALYDAATGAQLKSGVSDQNFEGKERAARSILETLPAADRAISPDYKRVALGSKDGTLSVQDSITGQLIVAVQAHAGAVTNVSFSPDGRLILTSSAYNGDETVRLWDAATAKALMTVGKLGRGSSGAEFSPDGERILSIGGDNIQIWSVPEILKVSPARQVEMACQRLIDSRSALSLSIAEGAKYGLHLSEQPDPDHPDMLLSPCKGIGTVLSVAR
jgi:WD40 repeat protein